MPFPARVLSRLRPRRSLLAIALMLTMVLPLQPPAPISAGARAHSTAAATGPVAAIGTSFNPARAEWLGLDYRTTYDRLLAMHFKVIRLSAYWSEVEANGYGQLDWLMARSAAAAQPVVLTVGMKGQGWPEYYIPPAYTPTAAAGSDLAGDQHLRTGVLEFISTTVSRYQASPALVAWQVENEPLNPAGPNRWWIGRSLLDREVASVRQADRRPLIVNAFGSFNMIFDRYSNRNGIDWKRLLGFESDTAENHALQTLAPGDILGLDVYTRIGYTFLGRPAVATADAAWAGKAGHWLRQSRSLGRDAWVTEVQAEPWEASRTTLADPRSTSAADIAPRVAALGAQGYGTILLWGAEYWFWRADESDPSWLEAVSALLAANSSAPGPALPMLAAGPALARP